MRSGPCGGFEGILLMILLFISRRGVSYTNHVVSRGLSMSMTADERFMKLAIRHAQHAYREKEVPVGAIIVNEQGQIIAASRNRVEESHDATAHAEIDCMRKAAQYMKNWRLLNCTLYTTLEPCPTCLSAAQSFRIKRIVYAARDHRLGACGSHVDLVEIRHPFHQVEIVGGVLEEESSILLRRFFQSIREGKYRYGSYDLGRGDTSPTTNSANDDINAKS